MNDLTERMRAATAAPPPSAIDLDHFISRERRRTRLLRWGGSGGLAAVLVAAVLAGPLLYAGGGGSDLSPGLPGAACPTPGANPTEVPQDGDEPAPSPLSLDRCAATADRLAEALRDALAANAPQVTAAPLAPTVFVYQQRYAQYEADLDLSGPAGAGRLRVEVMAAGEDPPSERQVCPAGMPEDRDCAYRITWSGEVLAGYATGFQNKAEAYLPDGTHVTAWASVPMREGVQVDTLPPPPLGMEQLLDLVHAPGLTLFPGVAASPRPTRDADREDLVSLIMVGLRRKLPDEEFVVPSAPPPGAGLRARVEVPGVGALTAEIAATCALPECAQPCPEPPGSDYCVVAEDGTKLVAGPGWVRFRPPSGQLITVTAEGALADRLTQLDLSALAELLTSVPPR